MRFLPEKIVLRNICSGERERFWIPLIWLPYLLFFVLQPLTEHVSRRLWVMDGLGTVVFLFLFFGMFWDKHSNRSWYYLGGIFALGLIFAPINSGAATFFIYSCAFAPFLAETEFGALRMQAVVVGSAALETWLLHISWWFFLYAGGFSAVIGAGNIFFAQRNRANRKLRMAHEEIEHLAKVAERERVQALGGTLERDSTAGTRIRIQFPLAPAKNGSH